MQMDQWIHYNENVNADAPLIHENKNENANAQWIHYNENDENVNAGAGASLLHSSAPMSPASRSAYYH